MKQNRFTALLLAILLASATSCGSSGTPSTDTTASDTTTEAETTLDSLPADLNFGGKKVRIAHCNMEGLDYVTLEAEETGDIVNDAAYQRDIAVEERLNVDLQYISSPTGNGEKFLQEARSVILAGDDAYDIVAGIMYRMTPMAAEGCFNNLAYAPYIDYDQPWWADEYMDIISLNGNTRYVLAGDISSSMISCMSSVFFNQTMFEANFGDSDALYQLVLDGKWTVDKMREYITGVYQDLNADGKSDLGDVLGLATTIATPVDHFVYPMGMKLTTRDENGYPMLIEDQSRNVAIAEKVYELFYNTAGTFVSNTGTMIGKEFATKFSEGTTLFHAHLISAASKLRDAKDPYGIIPRPKLDEEQESYLTLVHDTSVVFAIPVTVTDIDAPCAVLELMAAKGHELVIPTYYEVQLKIKYAHDDISSQMLDIIHDNVTTDWVYANNLVMASGGSLGTIGRKLMTKKTADYMSTYDSLSAQVEASLQTLIENDQK